MAPDFAPIHVLVLEDNEVVAAIASHFLRRAGYHVRLAKSSEQAAKLLDDSRVPIAILVCDLEFDNSNGKAAALGLQAQKPGLRVAFICGTNCPAARHRTNGDPDSPCLGQPFTPSHLLRSVTEALAATA
jgi:DNA-binding NtrC family response regulator